MVLRLAGKVPVSWLLFRPLQERGAQARSQDLSVRFTPTLAGWIAVRHLSDQHKTVP
jgi:hypothetical protein